MNEPTLTPEHNSIVTVETGINIRVKQKAIIRYERGEDGNLKQTFWQLNGKYRMFVIKPIIK